MKAQITNQRGYKCAPDGHTLVVFPMGAMVEGQVAEWAVADGAASACFDPREDMKVEAPPETKKRGRPRKNKADD